MISTQTSCSMQTALMLLEKRADLIGCCLGDMAIAVIDRKVNFDREKERPTRDRSGRESAAPEGR
jgi:hypothetical protein